VEGSGSDACYFAPQLWAAGLGCVRLLASDHRHEGPQLRGGRGEGRALGAVRSAAAACAEHGQPREAVRLWCGAGARERHSGSA
jgi:hypothetical protein